MLYKIRLTDSAEKEFYHLSDGKKKAIGAKLKQLKTSPTPPGSKKLRNYDIFWEIKAGDVRAIYREPEDNRIWVIVIKDKDHGSPEIYLNLYDRMH